MTTFDMSQMLPNETEDDYHQRPLFPLPTITKIISRHSGTVLDQPDPTNSLTDDELMEFDEVYEGELEL
jgi:hypothetical protein